MDKDELNVCIGRNVMRYRIKRGMTQAELAEKIGVSTAFLSRVECGQKSMKIHTLYELAEALSVTCDALLYSESANSHLNTIHNMLKDKSCNYLDGIEDLLKVCENLFFDTMEMNKSS